MIRLIIKELGSDHDGKVHQNMKTFDVKLPIVEKYLTERIGCAGCGSRSIIGGEVMVEEKEG